MPRLPELVRTPDEAIGNILKFETEIARQPKLRGRLGYVHAWYAARDASGRLAFAPSKFIGYRGINGKRYLAFAASSGGADGRRTERHLAKWFEVVAPRTPLGIVLSDGLRDFLARFDRVARSSVRIGLAMSDLDAAAGEHSRGSDARAADLLARIFSDPQICGGRPCISGTRMRVSDLLDMIAHGASQAEILADFPYIAEEDIAAALAYAARAVDHRLVRAA